MSEILQITAGGRPFLKRWISSMFKGRFSPWLWWPRLFGTCRRPRISLNSLKTVDTASKWTNLRDKTLMMNNTAGKKRIRIEKRSWGWMIRSQCSQTICSRIITIPNILAMGAQIPLENPRKSNGMTEKCFRHCISCLQLSVTFCA